MSWLTIVLVALPIALIATFMITRSRKYSTLFDESTFEEFYEHITKAIRAAVQSPGEPSFENGTAFRLSADIAASVSFAQEEDGLRLHIALSQPDGVTTHSVAARYGFFVVAILNKNPAQMTPFYTPSYVHHIVLQLESADIVFNSFEESYRELQQNYHPIRFQASDEP